MEEFIVDIVKRFLKYVSYETTSDEFSKTKPSTNSQVVLLKELVEELKELGVDAFYKDGYTYGKVKSDCAKDDTLFLMAHVDTSSDASGKDVKARIVHFTGEDIILNDKKKLSIDEFPLIKYHLNHDLIVTDRTTLLGADDKAGIAIIMDVLEKALKKGGYPNITVCFSSDEEIGRGTENIDIDYIKETKGKMYAYTLDGGCIQAFQNETFNAKQAKVEIDGVSIHPSIGKNKLINSQEVFMKFHSLLPLNRPENTEGREGFIHLTSSNGITEHSTAIYILRSFESCELERFENSFYHARDEINKLYNKDLVNVSIKDQYRNMYEIIKNNRHVVDLVHKVYKELDINLVDVPIRGGTDGALLSYLGLPCPNLGTGGDNFHGVLEYLDIDEMKMMTNIISKMMEHLK